MSVQAKHRKHAEHDQLLGLEPVPVEPTISPEYFDLESERIFRRAWLNVGVAGQLPQENSYFVHDMPNTGSSVIVTRDSHGKIRAFHNVCAHRGNRLVRTQCGRRLRFVCGYHGWTYDQAGRLLNVPDEDQFPCLDKSRSGLLPVAVDCWNGFIFINLSPEPAETLPEFLDGLYTAFDGFPFEQAQLAGRYVARVKANWKVCMDIGSEGYHVAYVHRSSAPDSHISKENPQGHLPKVRLFGVHRSTAFRANPGHKPTPAEGFVMRHAATVLQGSQGQARPAGLNLHKTDNWGFDTHILFPNTGMLMGPGWFVTHRYWPVAVDETIWETSLHSLPPRSFGERVSQEFSAVFTRDLIREDWAQVQNVQKGLATGALSHVQLSDQEVMVRHAYKVIDDHVRTP